jgi:hypothetical protein
MKIAIRRTGVAQSIRTAAAAVGRRAVLARRSVAARRRGAVSGSVRELDVERGDWLLRSYSAVALKGRKAGRRDGDVTSIDRTIGKPHGWNLVNRVEQRRGRAKPMGPYGCPRSSRPRRTTGEDAPFVVT